MRQTDSRPFIKLLAAILCACPFGAFAGISLLQPPRNIDSTKPLVLTLLITEDDTDNDYDIPEELQLTATADLLAPLHISLPLEKPGPRRIHLNSGQFYRVNYAAQLPDSLRGTVIFEWVDSNVSPVLLTLIRADSTDYTTPPVATTTALAITPTALNEEISLPHPLLSYDPLYFIAGGSGKTTAKFQFSFKYLLFEAADPRSKGMLGNLYFGYTQLCLWDLTSNSSPFVDSNYRPSIFYYLPDTGIHYGSISHLSIRAGLEHESNGRDGSTSRNLNTVFVQPRSDFGDLSEYHLSFAPKLYNYTAKSDNPDIQRYRGYGDFQIAFGKPDSFQLTAMLRKGSGGDYGSIDTQLTYPMARLVTGVAGYLMLGYFSGYGETLLTYNQKEAPQFRVGYALSRF